MGPLRVSITRIFAYRKAVDCCAIGTSRNDAAALSADAQGISHTQKKSYAMKALSRLARQIDSAVIPAIIAT
jgi:hypothetical protein